MGISMSGWATTKTYTVTSPAESNRYIQDGVLISGTIASKKLANQSSKACYYLATGSYAPISIISKAANISSITIEGNRDADSDDATVKAINVLTSSDLLSFSTPSSGDFTASRTNNGSTVSVTSLTDIPMIGRNQSYLTSITITFSSPVMGVRITFPSSTATSIKSVSVNYDDAITPDPQVCEIHASGSTAYTGTDCTVTSNGLQAGVTLSTSYYYIKISGDMGSSKNYICIDLGEGKSFRENDEIWVELAYSSLVTSAGVKLNNSISTTGAITVAEICTIPKNQAMYAHYKTLAASPWNGSRYLYIGRQGSSTRIYSVSVHRAAVPEPPTFDPSSGSLKASTGSVSISTETDGSTIFYKWSESSTKETFTYASRAADGWTLNNTATAPNVTGTRYLNAVAYKDGKQSVVSNQAFTIDGTAPSFTYSPLDDAINVGLDAVVSLTASEDISKVGEIISGTIQVGEGSPSDISFALSDNVLTYSHSDFAYGTTYTITLSAGQVQDAVGNQNAETSFSFTTGAAAPPTISIETSKSSDITAGESITLTATVGGNPTPALKWYVNTENNTSTGSEVLGETSATYTFDAIAGTRYYYAKATNSVSTTTSNVITILGLVSRTVTYKNGNYTIFTEEVFDGNAITHTTHALNSRTFVGWYTDPELTSAAPATITSDITLYGKWTLNGGANYSTTANFEKYVLDNGTSTTGLAAYLTSHYFSSDKFTEWDNINADPAKDYDNYPYLGLKKPKNTSGGYITALVPANKTITFVLGSMAAAATLYIDGVAQSGELAGSSTNKPASYSYTNTQISEYKLDITSISGTCMLKGIFIEDEARGSYARTDLTAGNYGTICLPYAVAAGDYENVSFYNVAGYNGESTAPTSIIIEEETGALVAGRPYIFKVADGAAQIFVFHKGDAASVDSYNGLIGSFTGTTVAASTAGTVGNYLLSSNTFVRAGTGCSIGENRAYLSMSAASPYTPAPGHRVIELSAETDNATNIENLNNADNVVKFLENGQLLIKRDGITYDALGRIVK